jgi:hypothetical protein
MKPSSIPTSTSRLQTLSNRVKVWTREVSAHTAAKRHEPANPIYLIAAITLGIPALLAIPLIGMNPGIHRGLSPTSLRSLQSQLSSLRRSSRSNGSRTNPLKGITHRDS